MKFFFDKHLKNNKKAVLSIIAVILFFAVAMGFYYFGGNNKDIEETIQEIIVKKGDLKIDMVADSRAEFAVMSLYFKTSGLIKDIYLSAGDIVEKGDIIARLDAEKYELDLESARANYQMAQAKLTKSKEQYESKLLTEKERLDNAIIQYQPMEKVPEAFTAQEILIKKLAVDNALSSYEAAKKTTSDIKIEEASVAQVRAALKKAESALNDTIVRAPVDGRILSIAYKVGDNISGTNQFATITASSEVYVIAEVLEFDIADVYLGQEALMEFDAISNNSYKGKVTGINAFPDTSSSIVTYKVEVLLEDGDERIKSGMSGIISFIIEQEEDVLIIPNQAVKRIGTEQVVEKIDSSGQIVTQIIKTGFTDGSYAEVREGLSEGDKIIIRTKSSK